MSFLDQVCESISACFVYVPSQDHVKEDPIALIARKHNYLYEDPEMEIWFRRQCRDW
jgi:hypothetical protein